MRFAITFVCQSGELELKSLLLAASLRRHVVGDFSLVACIPDLDPTGRPLSAATRTAIQDFGIETLRISNTIDPSYAIANKVSCFDIAGPADRVLFLDSDIVCLRPLVLDEWFVEGFVAKPADQNTFSEDEHTWSMLYAHFNLPEPRQRVRATLSGQLMPPYFNAGVICVPHGAGFGEMWAECCRIIDGLPAIPNKRPHLDQIALPIAVQRLHFPLTLLDEPLNFPAHVRPLTDDVLLCHYHWLTVVDRQPRLKEAVGSLVEAHPVLAEVAAEHPGWHLFAGSRGATRARRVVAQSPPHDASDNPPCPCGVITGIPRSGTSHLCGVLHSLPDHVVINEPRAVFEILTASERPWRLPDLYEDLRRRILAGEDIENKVLAGVVIEDTAIHDGWSSYRPQVTRDDFALWTKNTLAYAARIDGIRHVMPAAPIVALVRHPVDTIASWKTTFAHLNAASVEVFPVGSPDDPFLTPPERERLQHVRDCGDASIRRALLWAHLAETFLARREELVLIRYEDLLTTPEAVVSEILRQLDNARWAVPLGHLPTHRVRTVKRSLLTVSDMAAIRAVCADAAHRLGYLI